MDGSAAGIDRVLGSLDEFLHATDDAVEKDSALTVSDALRRPWLHLDHVSQGALAVREEERDRLKDAASAEDRVRHDYTGRYSMELLQNAHDACADGNVIGSAWLGVTKTALLVGNEGIPFDAQRVSALIRLGGSSKLDGREQHHTIGYKGIGFTSVFELTDAPQVISTGARFAFNRVAAQRRVTERLRIRVTKVPVRSFPFLLDDEEWRVDADAVNEMLGEGASTVIRLPFRVLVDPDDVESRLRESLTPEVLLFMPNLDRLVFLSGTRSDWRKRSQSKKGVGLLQHLDGPEPRTWLTLSGSAPISAAAASALDDELWAKVRSVNVGIALPWSKGKPDPERGAQAVHVYFPTNDKLGRAILVHGDFYVDSSRRHISHEGPAGAISAVVARSCAGLLAQLAERIASHGNYLLRCLAPTEAPNGYGKELAALFDSSLAEARICKPISGVQLKRPREVRRLGTGLEPKAERALAALLHPRHDLLRIGDDRGASKYLAKLGTESLTSPELAERLAPSRSKVPYDKALAAVAHWYGSLSNTWETKAILRDRLLVQDKSRRWRRASEVVIPDRGTPTLPGPLRSAEYLRPKGRLGHDFVIVALGLPTMSCRHALSLLLDALDAGDFGQTANEKQAAFDFLFRVWQLEPKAVEDAKQRLDVVEVPVRKATQRSVQSWRSATEAYFPRQWTGDSLLEVLYGPLGEEEFLAMFPPTGPVQERLQSFLGLLGVASAPRMLDVDATVSPHRSAWRYTSDVSAAYECPDGHDYTPRETRGSVMDRLAEILDRQDRATARSLASYLAAMQRPFGNQALITCLHSGHRGSRKPRRAIGYHEWLLRTRPWIPVRTRNGSAFRRIEESWYDVREAHQPLVSVADLPEKVSYPLGLISGAKPTAASLLGALRELANDHPELADAPPELQTGAFDLLRKLDSSAGDLSAAEVPQLPSMRADCPVWSTEPMVPDLPGIELIPSLTLLPPGEWPGLHRMFGLRLASESVEVGPVYKRAPTSEAQLGSSAREQLVAFLTARGYDHQTLARRIGLLQEVPVERLALRLRALGDEMTVDRGHYLEKVRDRSRRISGRLYLVVGLNDKDLMPLAKDLAAYVEAPQAIDAILTFLHDPESLMRLWGLGESQIAEARAALLKYPRSREDESPDDLGLSFGGDDVGDPSAEVPEEQPDIPWNLEPKRATLGSPETEGTGASTSVFSGLPTRRVETVSDLDPAAITFEPAPLINAREGSSKSASSRSSGAGSSPGPRSSTDRQKIEQDAIQIAISYAERELGAQVRRVDDQNLGWDLELRLPDDSWLVEVKGFAASSSNLILTRRELDAARTHRDYRIFVVTGVAGKEGAIFTIANPGPHLVSESLEPMSWAVSWANLPNATSSRWIGNKLA